MRVIVGLEGPEERFRLLWLSESRSGIYIGYFTGTVDVHSSYHQDGTRHSRIAKSHHQRWQDVPLRSHSGVKQLLHASIPIHNRHDLWPRVASARDELIILNHSQFAGYDTLAVDALLASTNNDSDLNRFPEHAHEEYGFHHISQSTWSLSFFPNLVFALSFWAANTHAPVEA
jgi:hypothetical protein